ncbi:MAG: hypothetical protein OEL76_18555 [Siculibacillus sp.]|nr:hypothetical protein [Siculibacillus sp.]
MFDNVKRRWAERQADSTLTKVKDGIGSLSQLPPPHVHFAKSGLTCSHDGLVHQFGPFKNWNRKTRTAAMSQLLASISEAQKIRGNSISEQATILGSFGAQMLFFYYDSFELVDPKGAEIRQIIEIWFEFDPGNL